MSISFQVPESMSARFAQLIRSATDIYFRAPELSETQ